MPASIEFRVVPVTRYIVVRGEDNGQQLIVREFDADYRVKSDADDIACGMADQENGTFDPNNNTMFE
jgi:hypothetical protein